MTEFFLRSLLFCVLCVKLTVAFADEGMWVPMFLSKYNEADMQSKGLKLSAEDIYSVNHASLKDAVVQFGGGCTGELISAQGLLLTNHHCGRSRVQSHSTLENNYLENGYWAMKRSEELSNPGLTVTFLVRMEDVTSEVLNNLTSEMTEAERYLIIEKASKALEKKMVEGTHYEAKVKEFFGGNEYYIFITETFKDVRLVGAPPYSIGNFGGDTDNWIWPRHTGDFSLFRIYADSLNRPAEYSPDNVPYKPKKHFEISMRELKEGDFTMVFGFPGRTQEYLTSFAVKQLVEEEDPLKISIREKRLAVMEKAMDSDPQVKLNLTSKYAGISNYYKKYMGESRGLKKVNAVQKKQELEKRFGEWVNADENRKVKYANLLPELENTYNEFAPYNQGMVLYNEAFTTLDFVTYVNSFAKLSELLKSGVKREVLKVEVEKQVKYARSFLKNYNRSVDLESAKNQIKDIIKYMPEILTGKQNKKLNKDSNKYITSLFSTSLLDSLESIAALYELIERRTHYLYPDTIKLENGFGANDLAFQFVSTVTQNFKENIYPNYVKLDIKLDSLNRIYTQALREMQTDKLFYPDANSTLRLSYGKVEGYAPNDSVTYIPFSNLDELIAKENPNDKEFVVPAKLKELYQKKDYGEYAVNGTVPVCFIASNHTTGGNSGSPVLNAQGQLIGTNFDRNWEGTAADVMYDPTQARNISVDIRYTLFIIDKFAGAKYLLDEMKIVK
ncbi:MAG: Asp/Glu-specific dipeptidyl-peptidase [Bacteroidia bacterium]|nr:Asp/Glu-specific dipeptidyl-peptidase [Bacteroidia bacterium]